MKYRVKVVFNRAIKSQDMVGMEVELELDNSSSLARMITDYLTELERARGVWINAKTFALFHTIDSVSILEQSQ